MKRLLLILLLFDLFSCSSKDDVNKLNFLKRGNQAYSDENNKTAIRLYNEAIEIDSAFVDAWNNRGLAEMAENLNDEAIFSFNQALRYKPDYAEAQLNYVKANLAVGQYYAALDGLESLDQLWPDSSIVHFTRGLVYFELQDDSTAMLNFVTAWEKDSDNVEARVNMANIHYQNKNYSDAIDILKEVIIEDAGNSDAYNILAMCYSGMNDNEKALDAIELAIKLEPKNAYILNNKGYILMSLGRLDEADKLFVQSMKRDPYNGWVYRNLGLLRIEQEKNEEAERLLGKAFSIDPGIDDLAIDYFNLLLTNGKKAQACDLNWLENGVDQLEQLKSRHCNN